MEAVGVTPAGLYSLSFFVSGWSDSWTGRKTNIGISKGDPFWNDDRGHGETKSCVERLVSWCCVRVHELHRGQENSRY